MLRLEARYRPFAQYAFAVVSVCIALIISPVIPPTLLPNQFLICFLAVILSAWYGNGNLLPGLLATALAVVGMAHFRMYIAGTTDLLRTDITRLVVFAVVVVIITFIQTRHRRVVDALSRSRDQLEIYMRDMANGVIVQDRDGKLVYGNYEAARLMGFVSVDAMLQATRDELLANIEIFDEFGEPFPLSSLPGRLALLGMRYPETVLRYRYRNSSKERWAFDKARPVFDAAGQVQYSVSLFLDVTELKEAQQALTDQREQMQVILQSIADGVIATNSEGKVTFVNPVASSLTGWTEGAALDKPSAQLVSLIDETTRQALPNPVAQVLAGSELAEVKENALLVSQRGTERSVEGSAAPIRDAQGHPAGTVLVLRDMSDRKLAQSALRLRVRQQEVVARLGLSALQGIGLTTLIQEATDALAQTLKIDYAKVLELLPDGSGLLLRAGYGWEDGLVGKAILDTGKDSQGGFTLLTNEPVIVEDLNAETRFNAPALLRSHNVVSGMSVIIGGGRQPWGVLGAHTTTRRVFTQDDVNFLQSIANLLASSINRERFERAERDERVFAEALRDTAEALSGTLDLAQVLDRILENVKKVVPHDAADIMLIEQDAARVVRYQGYAEDQIVGTLRDLRLSLSETATLNSMMQTGQPLLINETRNFEGWVKIPHMEWLRSYVSAPLVSRGSVKGFLNLTSIRPNAFTEVQAKRLQAFAAQATAAIQNAQLYGEALKRADENTLRQLAQDLRRHI